VDGIHQFFLNVASIMVCVACGLGFPQQLVAQDNPVRARVEPLERVVAEQIFAQDSSVEFAHVCEQGVSSRSFGW
jgi:hypothetical protein